MITASVTVYSRIPQTREKLEKEFKNFLGELAAYGAKDIRDNFTTDHVPSYPGEPPAIRTGFLRSSVDDEVNATVTEAYINIGAYYAEWLEYGTERIAPRPFVRPAVHRLELDIPTLAERKFNVR